MAEEKKDKTLSPEEIDELDLKAENESELLGTTEQSVMADIKAADQAIETADEEERIPVSYDTAEEALLSMFIQDDDAAQQIAQSGLRDIHFMKRKNRLMFPIILQVRYTKGVCNFDLVANALEKESMPDGQSVLDFAGGMQELSKIITCAPPTIDTKVVQSYVDIVHEQYKLSKVKEITRWIAGQKKFDEMKMVEKIATIQQILSDETLGKYGLVPLDVLVADSYKRYEDRKAHPEKYKGISTGFYWLNKCQVVSKKHVCVVGARTNVGKSVLVSNVITRMLLEDVKVLLFTPELDKKEYIDRLICGEARVDIDAWKAGIITDADNTRIGMAQFKLTQKAHNLYVEDKGSQSCGFILNSVKKHMMNHQVDVVVIDYLQKLRYWGDNTKRAITDMMEKFCSFAKDNDMAFIVLSQLRRSDNPEPQLNDLKESGDIENFADSVVLLHRSGLVSHSERNKGWYKVEKNREGQKTDAVALTFSESYLKFTEDDIPQDGVTNQGSLIEGYDDNVPDEDQPTEQKVAADIIKKQGKV